MSDAIKYAVVIEQAGANFSAYVPDLPGCISVGHDRGDGAQHP